MGAIIFVGLNLGGLLPMLYRLRHYPQIVPVEKLLAEGKEEAKRMSEATKMDGDLYYHETYHGHLRL